jgi:hypothetical protein
VIPSVYASSIGINHHYANVWTFECQYRHRGTSHIAGTDATDVFNFYHRFSKFIHLKNQAAFD